MYKNRWFSIYFLIFNRPFNSCNILNAKTLQLNGPVTTNSLFIDKLSITKMGLTNKEKKELYIYIWHEQEQRKPGYRIVNNQNKENWTRWFHIYYIIYIYSYIFTLWMMIKTHVCYVVCSLTHLCPAYSIEYVWPKFQFYFMKGSSKKIPMSVAPMSR